MSNESCSCSRRSMISSLVGGSLLLPGIISELLAESSTPEVDPLAPRAPHFPARAKRVIFMNMSGGFSHVDSFDYKPRLFSEKDWATNMSSLRTRKAQASYAS